MVNGLGGGLVDTSVDGVGQVGDGPDIGGGAAISSRPNLVHLIELVIEEKPALVLVNEPALVRVGVAVVRSAGDDDGVGLGGDIVDGEGVLVETEADLLAAVLLGGTLVDHALSIVNVAVLADTAGGGGLGGVRDVDNEEATGAGGVAGIGTLATTDGVDVLVGSTGNDVVGGTNSAEEGDVGLLREDLGLVEPRVPPRLDLEELLEVEDLDTVTNRLGADVGVVANDLDVSPRGDGGLGVETAEVLDLSAGGNLDESNTVSLAYDTELTARLLVGPSPDVVSFLAGGSEILVGEEAVEVDVVASVLLRGLALLTGLLLRELVVETRASENTTLAGGLPLLGLDGHDALHLLSTSLGGDGGGDADGSGNEEGGELHDCGREVVRGIEVGQRGQRLSTAGWKDGDPSRDIYTECLSRSFGC